VLLCRGEFLFLLFVCLKFLLSPLLLCSRAQELPQRFSLFKRAIRAYTLCQCQYLLLDYTGDRTLIFQSLSRLFCLDRRGGGAVLAGSRGSNRKSRSREAERNMGIKPRPSRAFSIGRLPCSFQSSPLLPAPLPLLTSIPLSKVYAQS
jgi:hypothetical protein